MMRDVQQKKMQPPQEDNSQIPTRGASNFELDGVYVLGFGVCAAVLNYGLFRLVAVFVPELRKEWEVGAPLVVFIFALTFYTAVCAIIVRFCKSWYRTSLAVGIFLGSCVPWGLRVITALWEFVRGAGI